MNLSSVDAPVGAATKLEAEMNMPMIFQPWPLQEHNNAS
jgi:hypothetical protein